MAKKQAPHTPPVKDRPRNGKRRPKDRLGPEGARDPLEVFIVRHADAGKRLDGERMDMQRPLSPKGREDAKKLSQLFKGLSIVPDAILSSPLPRAVETAALLAQGISSRKKPLVWEELSPRTNPEVLSGKLSTLRDMSSVVLVGHEPSLTGLVRDLVGSENGLAITLRKAGVARVRVTRFTPRMQGELRWLLSPKLLRRIG